jgi:hypothetical protein
MDVGVGVTGGNILPSSRSVGMLLMPARLRFIVRNNHKELWSIVVVILITPGGKNYAQKLEK